MKTRRRTDDELRSLFRELVLVLGGVFALRRTDTETIEAVAAGLERAYRRARRRCGLRRPWAGVPAPHPAIAALLRLLDADESER